MIWSALNKDIDLFKSQEKDLSTIQIFFRVNSLTESDSSTLLRHNPRIFFLDTILEKTPTTSLLISVSCQRVHYYSKVLDYEKSFLIFYRAREW